MGYRTFTTGEYSSLRHQHNIMVLVGNGFDIQVARRYESRFSPRYPAFYHYLAARDFDPSNLVVQQMAAAKADGQKNWSDIEGAIGRLLRPQGGWHFAQDVYQATLAIQGAFSEYLELVAPPDLLARVGKDSAEEREREVAGQNAHFDGLISGLREGRQEAVEEYIRVVLANLAYPDGFDVTEDGKRKPAGSPTGNSSTPSLPERRSQQPPAAPLGQTSRSEVASSSQNPPLGSRSLSLNGPSVSHVSYSPVRLKVLPC